MGASKVYLSFKLYIQTELAKRRVLSSTGTWQFVLEEAPSMWQQTDCARPDCKPVFTEEHCAFVGYCSLDVK